MSKHLVVAGGGAAGFFCAVNAARMNPMLKVTIVEKTGKLLQKVKISGGGRCNVTHACYDPAVMIRHYPRGANFLKKAFHHFFTVDTIDWFQRRGVQLKTEADGRMFPVTDSSQTIIDCLMQEAARYGVSILLNHDIKSVQIHRSATGNVSFELQFAAAPPVVCNVLCIAAGGYPKPPQYDWLRALGHTIEAPVPSLFTFNMPGHAITKLMGVAVEDAAVKIMGTKLQEQGPVLITHWGLSGPAVLKLSARAARELHERQYHCTALVNWLPAVPEQELREQLQRQRMDNGAQKIYNGYMNGIPKRLWHFLLEQSGIAEDTRRADVPAKSQNLLIKNITAMELPVSGKTTFKEEFVTAGGIQLSEVDAATMQSRIVPHLFFAGEILNVDGVTGGFNFQNAWTTGFIAAQAIAKITGG
jgi:predicted Rossmann fold flavoprotein